MAVPLRPERDGVAKPKERNRHGKECHRRRSGPRSWSERRGADPGSAATRDAGDARRRAAWILLAVRGRGSRSPEGDDGARAGSAVRAEVGSERGAPRRARRDNESEVTLGGRRIGIRRLRARSVDGQELRLPSYELASSRDPLDARTLEAIAIGVSTRKYGRSLDPLAAGEVERSVSKSSVSRRFVAMSSAMLTGGSPSRSMTSR